MRNHHKILGFALLALAAVMGVVGSGTGAEAQQADGVVRTEKTGGEAVGASVFHPAGWSVSKDPYTYDGTYGYTLWRSDTDRAHDHGGKPAMRVALAPDLEPGGIGARVRGLAADHPDLPVKREDVAVGREHEGVAVGPIPGSTPSTEVYVPVNGRVYVINAYAEKPGEEGLGEQDRELLSGIRFESPSRTVGSLDVAPANAPESLYPAPGEDLRETTKAPEGDGKAGPDASATTRGGGESRIQGGCWRADPRFYVQTIHGYKANSAADDLPGSGIDRIPTGWTRIGLPNFWGQYSHGGLGYGRCTEPNWANDQYAVDYPLNTGDAVFSPFSCGTVTFAGRNRTHADYGILVSIRACNGKYVSLQGHLSALRSGLNRGDRVNRDTIIGWAGATGGGNIPVGRPHVHQAFYRYPKYTPDGAPYGGAGLQVNRLRYVGTAARRTGLAVRSHAYSYDRVRPRNVFCREGIRCGEGFRVSN
jgi:murein DD-endopeptidase MepM/ murein hydrolase activator NlpD